MRLTGSGARLSAVLCAVIVAASALMTATPSPAASTLDRNGRFAIQWWTIDDGLPEAPVNGVAFAPDGTLYCTTSTRIVCFDGDSFEPHHSRARGDRRLLEPRIRPRGAALGAGGPSRGDAALR